VGALAVLLAPAFGDALLLELAALAPLAAFDAALGAAVEGLSGAAAPGAGFAAAALDGTAALACAAGIAAA
jgi:hypothetical protein